MNARERRELKREARASWKPSEAMTRAARHNANRESWELTNFNPVEWLRQVDADPDLSDMAKLAARALISTWVDQQVMPKWTEALKRELGVADHQLRTRKMSDV